jgi:hypothetical protein
MPLRPIADATPLAMGLLMVEAILQPRERVWLRGC